jgi:hypothetical protein
MIKTCHFKIKALKLFLILFFILVGCAKKNLNSLIIPPNFSDLPIAESSEKIN